MTAYVYFAKFSNQTIKIGVSTCLDQRIAQLQRETGLRASFIGRLELHNPREARLVERALHRTLGADWLRGEYFTDTATVRAELRRLLNDPAAVRAIVARVESAERDARRQAAQPRLNVRVIARLARDVVSATPEAPDLVLARILADRCRAYRIPFDDASLATALRIEVGHARSTKKAPQHATASTLAKIIHALLAAEPFESLGDLIEALKWRLASLRISYTHDELDVAFRKVASARPLPVVELPRHRRRVEHEPDRGLSHAEAAAILDRLGIRL